MGSLLSKALAAGGRNRGGDVGKVYEVPLEDLLELVDAYITGQISGRAFGDVLDPVPKNKKIASSVMSTRGQALFIKAIRRLYAEGYTLGGGVRPT